MNCDIYCRVVRPARESADGDTPEKVAVTKEANGYAVWTLGEEGMQLVRWFCWSREEAIDFAVSFCEERREQLNAGAKP